MPCAGIESLASRRLVKILRIARRATGILRQLLLNAHENKATLRTVSINHLVLQTIELQQASLSQENIRVELDLDSEAGF